MWPALAAQDGAAVACGLDDRTGDGGGARGGMHGAASTSVGENGAAAVRARARPLGKEDDDDRARHRMQSRRAWRCLDRR